MNARQIYVQRIERFNRDLLEAPEFTRHHLIQSNQILGDYIHGSIAELTQRIDGLQNEMIQQRNETNNNFAELRAMIQGLINNQ